MRVVVWGGEQARARAVAAGFEVADSHEQLLRQRLDRVGAKVSGCAQHDALARGRDVATPRAIGTPGLTDVIDMSRDELAPSGP